MIVDVPKQAFSLGSPSSEYRIHRNRFVRNAALSFLGFLLLWLLDIVAGSTLIIMFFALTLLALAGYYLVMLVFKHDLRVIVFPEGITQTVQGSTQVVRWDDVSCLWERVEEYRFSWTLAYSVWRYTILTYSGERLIFDRTLKDIDAFGQTLKHKIGERLVPKITATLKTGQSVKFGDLSLSNQGLRYKEKLLTWDELKTIKVTQGQIYIQAKRRRWPYFASLKTRQVPNAFIFLRLMKRYVENY
ncbi:MAG: hypothetical protein PVI78_08855 [Anaerolineales bacterium]|jgi:hypothetical protein